MTNEEVIALAHEADTRMTWYDVTPEEVDQDDLKFLVRFARLVRNAALEEAAEKCDTKWNGDSDTFEYAESCNECAEAIRAMKEETK